MTSMGMGKKAGVAYIDHACAVGRTSAACRVPGFPETRTYKNSVVASGRLARRAARKHVLIGLTICLKNPMIFGSNITM
jgi:hypothetical protein